MLGASARGGDLLPLVVHLSKKATSFLKASSGDDELSIQVKGGSTFFGKLICNWELASNNLPILADESGAILTRLQTLVYKNSNLGKEDLKLWSKQGIEDSISQTKFTRTLNQLGYGRDSEGKNIVGLRPPKSPTKTTEDTLEAITKS